jgi:phage-related protein
MLLCKYQVRINLPFDLSVKILYLDKNALKDFNRFPDDVIDEFGARFEILKSLVYLEKPFGKKLIGYKNLFEVIVKYKGQWRALYSYVGEEYIIILHCFRKKMQKTTIKDIDLALKRLKYYI